MKIWNRYELRFRQEMAVSVVQELLRYRDVAGLAMEVLNSKYDFRKADRQHDNTKKALPNLSSVGGTDERYR